MPSRNKSFLSRAHEPFRHDSRLNLDDKHTTGAFSFLNPTRARLNPSSSLVPSATSSSSSLTSGPAHSDGHDQPKPTQPGSSPSHSGPSQLTYLWRSRDNRKGRHPILITAGSGSDSGTKSASGSSLPSSPSKTSTLAPTSSPRSILHTFYLMLTTFAVWDISWDVAVLFVIGSVIWVLNGFFVYQPLVDPSTEFDGEISVAGGWSAFVGATVFEIGSLLLMLEAVNENREGCFGWAVERVLTDEGGEGRIAAGIVGGWRLRKGGGKDCAHHHANRGNLVGKGLGEGKLAAMDEKSGGSSDPSAAAAAANQPQSDTVTTPSKRWQWFPSWHDLRTHYIHELGFLACLAQLFGATIFWISGFTAIPAVQNSLASTSQPVLDIAYWIPQVVGGSGFIVSGVLFMLETQEKWYKPAWGTLGWHIGFWNLVGALGFTLCGALGMAFANPGAQYQAALATFWGSWAFLIASMAQWYEGVQKWPVEVVKAERNGNGNEKEKEKDTVV